MGEYAGLIVMFLVAALVLAGMVGYALIKMYVRLRTLAAERKETTDVGFVVETFHSLVAELKQKERELDDLRREAVTRAETVEGYNENILQSVPSGVVSTDSSGFIVKVNAAAERILMHPASELAGRPLAEALSGLQAEPGAQRGQCAYHTPAGRRLWLGYSRTPLLDVSGKEIGSILVFTDLTELKAFEAQAELRHRLMSLGEMAAGIAHELRNSMGVVSGYMRLLRRKAGEQALQTVSQVEAEIAVMERIIADFMSFARPGEAVLADVDLAALAQACAVQATELAEGVKVRTMANGPIVIRSDEVLLRQALMNLVKNAIEATPKGGEVMVEAVSESGPYGDRAVIRVSDTGHGIDDGIRNRIFNPFFTTKDRGTGLGLAIVHRSVTALGGDVSLRPNEPCGTVFTITLPVS